MFDWAINYFSPAEFLVFLWLCGILATCFIYAVCIYAHEFIKWYRKTPDERAIDWVNANYEKQKRKKSIIEVQKVKREYIKVNDIYTHNGNLVVITAIHGGEIYAAEAIIDNDCNLSGFIKKTEKRLTDYEIEHLTY